MAKITKKRLSAALALNTAVLGIAGYSVKDNLNNSEAKISSPALISESAKDIPEPHPFQITIQPAEPDVKIAEPQSAPAKPSETTFASLRTKAPEHTREFFDIAMEVQKKSGFDWFIGLAKLDMETMHDRGFVAEADRNTNHSAKGLWQIKPEWLVTEVMRHGHDLSFYPVLKDDDPLKLAIDTIRAEQNAPKAKARLEAQIDQAITTIRAEKGDPNLNEIEPKEILASMPDPAERALYAMVWDDVRAGELVGRASLAVNPKAHIDNFDGSWEEELPHRMEVAEEVYGYHNQNTGITYQFAIADNPDLKHISPSNQTDLTKALLVVSDLSAGSAATYANKLKSYANANAAVYPQLAETPLGCIRFSINESIQARMNDIIDFPVKPEPVSFTTNNGVNVTQLSWETIHCSDTVTTPKYRPDNFAETVATAQATQTTERFSYAPKTVEIRSQARSLRPGDSS